ncbi:hypothetical protein AKJ29_01040 [Aliiroseovarius crassostreae]|uniref:Transposase n=1 Tax=Aliiroseovarius crassostreae TaxID=154981 RepID=A0A0P7JNM7_9RHOB|nr:hypothetical protein AKJ29_01040 [Aliiroseovarius crassostreae]
MTVAAMWAAAKKVFGQRKVRRDRCRQTLMRLNMRSTMLRVLERSASYSNCILRFLRGGMQAVALASLSQSRR